MVGHHPSIFRKNGSRGGENQFPFPPPSLSSDLEDRKESAASVFQREVQPLLARHPGVWPPECCGADSFEWACGMVQSRAFHLATENWVTMAKSEGERHLYPPLAFFVSCWVLLGC